jgi:hypothetical protein
MPPVIAAIGGIVAALGIPAGSAAAGEALPENTEFAANGWPVIQEETETQNAIED